MESSQLSGTSSRPCKPTTSRFDDDSQPSLSQDVFLPPLEDTQESELIEVDEDFFDGQSGDLPTTNNPATTNDPPKPNLVSRPEGIESLSDLKIDFQYPKAPAPRRMFKSSTGPHPHTGLPPRSAPYQPPNGPHPNAELHTRRGPYDPPIPNTFKQTESTQGRLPGREEGPLHEESWVQPPSSSDQTMQAGSSDPDEERRREHGEEVIVSHHESVYRPPQVNEEKPEQVVSRGTPPEKPRVGKQESINHPVVCEARSAAKAGRPLPYRAAHNELPKSLEDIRKRALAQTSSPRRASPNKVSATHDPGVAIDLSPSRNAQNPHDQYRVSRNSQKAKHRATHQSPGDLAFDEGRGQATAKTSTHKHHSPRDHDPVASHQIRPVARPLSRNSTVSNMAKHRAPRRSRPERLSPNFEHEGLESRKDIARAMNKYYAYEERLAKHWTKKFRDFQDQVEDQLAAKDALVQQHVADIASRDEIIAEWKAKVQETQTLHQEQASEHEMSRSRIKKLEEKIRTLRGRLNQATEEQQKIYAACSKKCQKVTSELELKEKEHKMAVEHALQTSESAQAKIKKSVAEVTVASRTETERLNKIVEVQKAQLEERGKEAKREREAAEYLQTQLDESQKMNSESLKLLATQNTDLLQRAEQQQSKTDSMQICIGNQDQKLGMITKELEEVRSATMDPESLMETLKAIQKATVATVVAAIEKASSTQDDSSKTIRELGQSIESIQTACSAIEEKLEKSSDASDWRESYEEALTTTREQGQEIQYLQQHLKRLQNEIDDLKDERDTLAEQVSRLQTLGAMNEANETQITTLNENLAELGLQLNERETDLHRSNESMKTLQEDLKKAQTTLQQKKAQMLANQKKHEEEIAANSHQHKQALNQAVAEGTAKAQDENEQLKKTLQEAQNAGGQLQNKLAEMKGTYESAANLKIADELRVIQDEMQSAKNLVGQLTEKLEASEGEGNKLKGALERWVEGRVEMSQIHKVLARLRKEQIDAKELRKEMQEALEVEKKLAETLEYHETNVAKLREDLQQNDGSAASPVLGASLTNLLGDEARDALDKQLGPGRRVIVQSPAIGDELTLPVSAERERWARENIVPQGIMKVVTRSVSRELSMIPEGNVPAATQSGRKTSRERPQPKVANRGPKRPPVTRTSYNRPVAGSVPENDDQRGLPVIAPGGNPTAQKRSISTMNKSATDAAFHQADANANEGSQPDVKRRRTTGHFVQGGAEPEKKLGLTRSKSEYFPQDPYDDSGAPDAQTSTRKPSLRGGPHVRQPSSVITYGRQGSQETQEVPQYDKATPSSSPTVQMLARSQNSAKRDRISAKPAQSSMGTENQDNQDGPFNLRSC